MKRPFHQLARFIFLSAGSVLFTVPLLWMLSTAVKPLDQTMSLPPRWLPTATTMVLDGQAVEVNPGVVPADAGPDTPVSVNLAYQWVVQREGPRGPVRVPVKMRGDPQDALVAVEINHRWEWVRGEGSGAQRNPVRLTAHDADAPALDPGTARVAVIAADGSLRRRVVPEAELVRVWGQTPDQVNRSYSVTQTVQVPRAELQRSYVPWNDRRDLAYTEMETQRAAYGQLSNSVDIRTDNFSGAVRSMGHFWRYLTNTLTLCLLTVVGTVVSCSLVAYGFSRIEWPGRDKVFLVVMGTMMVPFPVIMVPLYGVFRDLGWIGTLKPLWVPTLFASAFNVFLLRQFFMTIPKDLSEAARIDGCSELRIFAQIVLPLAKPALTVVALFQFLATWNDFLGPLIYLTDQKDFTLALGLQFFQSEAGGTQWHHLMAASTLVVAPVILLFFLAQRVFIEGVSMSGLKG